MSSFPGAVFLREKMLLGRLPSAGGNALFVRTDVSREEDMATALIEKTVATFGGLHIAFNNAGSEGQFGTAGQPSRRSSSIGKFATSISVACCCQ